MSSPTAVTTVTATDGVVLAVHRYTEIDPARPTILAIHGYPDNHHVWDGVAEDLSSRFNVVAYDVRGAGDSGEPADRSGYLFPQLVADANAVIDHLGVDQVHLLAHDWGSIQGWAVVTDPAVMPKIASYTSISGPNLAYAGKFLRSARDARSLVDIAKQGLASYYTLLFQAPKVPELFWRSKWGPRLLTNLERIGRRGPASQSVPRTERDYVNGVNLYRANMPGSFLNPPADPPRTTVPVQLVIPSMDMFVTPALQRFHAGFTDGGRVVPIEGGHWVVTADPEVIARLTTEWVDATDAARD
ncbi:alpha/beta fold hydrolase [Mycolicibacterium brumae]|uniref:Alpha/beta hydrolase n=1 Tax=Mycolicibacterium brumae TaxID=85968 RepID=A0A2G5P4W0_9MYCO|nr:alpha/beta fold hydrolase [Mycolicibacterium brumae]MCV7193427.1 alpha/beta fold hydrolase [Mycolicibacterium brumae]PIB73150.1 alpha/beta hydrolase [Mycolicibacterium brumae]RWA17129.1 hypothetical protein MBRU_05760 [Mycolicibacterium brumae DSM 44177]UWW09298.1 alpha/beta fold hydrolase [Mycolicibacterium brumae]